MLPLRRTGSRVGALRKEAAGQGPMDGCQDQPPITSDNICHIKSYGVGSDCPKLIPKLPSPFQDGEEIPCDLVGATILDIGTIDTRSESGEFVIHYIPVGRQYARRLTLLFNERGMWIESSLICKSANSDKEPESGHE